jgi:hypothetical protein
MSRKNISGTYGRNLTSSKIFAIPMATRENAEDVSSERSAEVVGQEPMNFPESTWLKNPIAFMNQFDQRDITDTIPINDEQKIFDGFTIISLTL